MPQKQIFANFPREFIAEIEAFRKKVKPKAENHAKIFVDNLTAIYKEDFQPYLPNKGKDFKLDRIVLERLVVSFLIDIIRLQTYHKINAPDRHKYAAFIFKWVSKCRPIKALNENDYNNDDISPYLQANAHYAFACAFSFLENCKTPTNKEYESIIYTACFRDIYPEQWSILFHFMEKANLKEVNK